MYFMAKHPEAQERLYHEVVGVMGGSKYPTPEQLSQMPYMKGCVLESFRYRERERERGRERERERGDG